MVRAVRRLGGLALALLLIAACGDDEGVDVAEPGSTTGTTAVETVTADAIPVAHTTEGGWTGAMPDPVLGERMCACVVLRPGQQLAFEELVGFLTEQEIARHKLPERLEVLDELPVSTFGKVSKKTLVEMVTRQLEAERQTA